MQDFTYETHVEKWWNVDSFPLTVKKRNKKIKDALITAGEMCGVDRPSIDKMLQQYVPTKATVEDRVSFYENAVKYQADRRTITTPGRFLKRMYPTAPDKMLEAFSLFWKHQVDFESDDYVLSIGTTRQDFKDAFTKIKTCSSVDYDLYKSISDSCMRYAFSSLEAHPSEVYASGDFEVVTVKSKKGQTKARCVVMIKTLDGKPCYRRGAIYASDNYSGMMVLDHLKGMMSDADENLWEESDCWHGAKLLKIAQYDSNYICPYIDNNRYVLMDGDYLRVSGSDYIRKHDKEYPTNNTSGYVYLQDYNSYKFEPNSKKKS